MAAPVIQAVEPVSGKVVPVKAKDNGDGTFTLMVDIGGATVTLSASELEIGHVALKNNQTEEHQTVAPDGQAVDGTHLKEGALGLMYDPVADKFQLPGINSEHVAKAATPNRAAIKTDQKNVAVAGVAEQPPAQAVPDGFKLIVKAKKANTGNIFVGGSAADAQNAAKRWILEPNESISLAVANFDDVFIDAAVSTEGVELIVEI